MALTDDDRGWISQTLKGELNSFADRFATKADLDQFATKADLEAMETKLLTAFHQWASPIDARARSHAAAIRALDLEQEAISERLAKLEGT